MPDLIITGASRGIGRALALSVARSDRRLFLVARDRERLAEVAADVAARGGRAEVLAGDLGSIAGARALGEELAKRVERSATLVHNAGLWPARLERTAEGFERAFLINHLAPLLLQAPLVEKGALERVLSVSAGLIAAGRFDPLRTPTGEDFSRFRTYCTTKLCSALAMRDLAEAHPELDVLVLHPGVVRTDLGAQPGILGWLLERIKRRWESPETCAARLARILDEARWSPPKEARWRIELTEQPWPKSASEATRRAVREVTAGILGRLRT
jgi:NAD(P)-dependent dehydrogenase (short-subunit alcohol dehydrogenase family)